MHVKAVLFDLGNTLVKVWVPEITYQNVLSSLGVDRSIKAIRKALDQTEKEFRESKHKYRYGEAPYEEYWKRWDQTVLQNLGIDKADVLVSEILARWYEHADCSIYPDTTMVLNRLKRTGIRTGLVSTAYEEDITAILNKAHLKKSHFDVIVGANTIRKEKPHPDVFRYALSRLDAEPEQAMFVGDDVDNDYRGARAVGMHALLIDRESKNTKASHDVEKITTLNEILELIE